MRSLLRLTPALALSLALVTGCSGDDEPSSDADPSEGSSATEEAFTGHETGRCRAEVEITGAVEASWQGKAQVRRSDAEPSAIFTSQSENASISAYSETADTPATANVTVDDTTYTTPLGDDTGLEVAGDGSSASIDAEMAGIEGPPVQVVATFECGGQGKKNGAGAND